MNTRRDVPVEEKAEGTKDMQKRGFCARENPRSECALEDSAQGPRQQLDLERQKLWGER